MAIGRACSTMSLLPCPEEPAQEREVAQQGARERKDDPSQPADNPLPHMAQILLAFPAARTSLWLMVNRCYSAKLLFRWAVHNKARLYSIQGQDLVCALAEALEVLLAPFSSLSRHLWIERQPSGAASKSNFVTSANLLKFIHQILKVEATKPMFL